MCKSPTSQSGMSFSTQHALPAKFGAWWTFHKLDVRLISLFSRVLLSLGKLKKKTPDEDFHNFRVSRSGYRIISCCSRTSCHGFGSSKIVKGSVGQGVSQRNILNFRIRKMVIECFYCALKLLKFGLLSFFRVVQ